MGVTRRSLSFEPGDAVLESVCLGRDEATPLTDRPKRFFYCRTPLHSLIVQRIQTLSPGNDTIFYNPTSASPKHLHYFGRLKAERRVFVPFRYPLNSHIAAEIYSYLAMPRDVRRERYDEMYLASIGSLTFAALAGRNPGVSIRTFDDGTFNVLRTHFEAWIKDEGPVHHRMLWRLLSGLRNSEIVERSDRHYTIFDPSLSLFPEKDIVKINLFPENDGISAATKRELVVVLGTPIHLVAPHKAESYRRFVQTLKPDVYIPHPAEIRLPIPPKTDSTDTELLKFLEERIAEEIVWLLRRRGHPLKIHGFGSTALLNIINLGNVSNHLINGPNKEWSAVFASFGVATDFPL